MFATTTWPTATTQPHAAPGNDPQARTGVVRIRVTRRSMCSHRARRDVRVPRVRRADTYLVRMTRPATGAIVPLRPAPAAAPHRLRVAR